MIMKTLLLIAVVPLIGYIVASLSAIAYNASNKKKGYNGIPWSECLKPRKHFSFLIGFTLGQVPDHILEQFVIRHYHTRCKGCYTKGECDNQDNNACGCPPRLKAWSPFEFCVGSWDTIIWNKQEYEEIAKKDPAEITVSFPKRKKDGESTDI